MDKKFVLGINKGFSQTSITKYSPGQNLLTDSCEVYLRERLTRKKNDQDLFYESLSQILPENVAAIAESNYFAPPWIQEKEFAESLPFFEKVQANNASWALSKKSGVHFFNHHRCHAMAAAAFSPFEKALIVVFDGAGSSAEAFLPGNPELSLCPTENRNLFLECFSVYHLENGQVSCHAKEWQQQKSDGSGELRFLNPGLGMAYETVAKFVFGSRHEAGKIMGLAPFGRASDFRSLPAFLESLDWRFACKTRGKKDWEASPYLSLYQDVAASMQNLFEDILFEKLLKIRQANPHFKNLILTGGCALNCVFNEKLRQLEWFENVYVPPNPGDESISLGASLCLSNDILKPLPWSQQTSFLGPRPKKVTSPETDLYWAKHLAILLASNKIVAVCRGRSEVGPRALGHRSILANPSFPGLRDYLNQRIKGREDFRPYGASCLVETTPEYFEVGNDFRSPFMSFAPKTKLRWKSFLQSVTHVDGTSRIQTVEKEQDPFFHELLRVFKELTGCGCVLNTSMNVMGEPLVETHEDARRFFDKTPVDFLFLEDHLLEKDYSIADEAKTPS